MKKIEATIRPEMLDAVKEGLEGIGVVGMTITDVCGRGRQKGLTIPWRAGEYRVDVLPKVKIEIVLMDDMVSKAISTIMNKARTGDRGDGKIFVLPVENAIRVRTGDTGDNAV